MKMIESNIPIENGDIPIVILTENGDVPASYALFFSTHPRGGPRVVESQAGWGGVVVFFLGGWGWFSA